MKNNLTCVSVKLPYKHSDSKLLNEIESFVFIHKQKRNLIADYAIRFDFSSIPGITFSLLTSNKNKLVKIAKEHFKNLTDDDNNLVFNFFEKERGTFYNDSFATDFSTIIINALKNDIIDEESIVIFTFYLQTALIKTIGNIEPGFIQTLTHESKGNKNEPKQKIDISDDYNTFDTNGTSFEDPNLFLIEKIMFNDTFKENEQDLLKILDEIETTDHSENGNPENWLGKWIILCNNTISHSAANQNLINKYKKIVNLINQQLGISSRNEALLSYFIDRVFKLINPPNAMILGAQKCGTSTLHTTLISHSAIKGSTDPQTRKLKKEINFFSHPANWRQGLEWYFSHFSGSSDVFIDSSPNYFCSKESSLERMKLLIPDAKLVICVRNPVYRSYSQYNYYKQRMPVSKPWDWRYDQDFLTNIELELTEIKNNLNAGFIDVPFENPFSGLLLRGVYIGQINRLLKFYDRSQIYITIMDQWAVNYKGEVDKIQQFLEIKREVLPCKIKNKSNYADLIDDRAKKIMTDFYKPYNEKLFEFLGYEIPEWC